MGKYKHEGKGRNISVSGGQERKDLFKDMSGGYNAMGDSNQPLYKYDGSAFKQRYSKSPAHKELVGNQNQLPDHLVKAIKAAPEMKGSPMYKRKHQVHGVDSKASEPKGNMKGLSAKTVMPAKQPKQTARIETRMKTVYPNTPLEKSGCTSGGSSKSPYKLMGDPKKKLKGKINKLSGKHKKLYDAYEQGQKVDMGKLGRVEDKLEKKEKKYSKKYGSSPYSMMDNPTAKPKGKMKKEGKLKATMTKKMTKLPKQAAKISGPYKNKK